jgi:hypothetical protein
MGGQQDGAAMPLAIYSAGDRKVFVLPPRSRLNTCNQA